MKTFTMSDEDAIILEKIMLDYVEYRPEYFGSLVKAVLGDEPLRPCPFCGRQRPYVSRVELPTCWEMYVLCEGCGVHAQVYKGSENLTPLPKEGGKP